MNRLMFVLPSNGKLFCVNDTMIQWMSEWLNAWMRECVNDWINQCYNAAMLQCYNEWVKSNLPAGRQGFGEANVWMYEWVNECMKLKIH